MPQYGLEAVLRAIRYKQRTGKLTTGTLSPADGSADIAYAYVYPWPGTEATGLSAEGSAITTGTITVYRSGESGKPRADDTLTVGSFSWLITSVETRLNANESSGYAVHDCRVARPAMSAG